MLFASPRDLGLHRLVSLGLLLCTWAWTSTASADDIAAQPSNAVEVGLQAIEELSYEAIVEPSEGHHATLRLRMALHNASAVTRDLVMTVAMPRGSQLQGARAARDGVWTDAVASHVAPGPGRRDPGTVYVRSRPYRVKELPAAEIVAFSLPSDSTLQVEIEARVYPELLGERWRIELPSRSRSGRGLSDQRRILVRDQHGAPASFWVDNSPNGTHAMMLTRGDQPATVEWPATLKNAPGLRVHYETQPDRFGGGDFRLILQLGPTNAPRPDHLTFVVDRSRSTSPTMQRDTQRLIAGLLDQLDPQATFDAIGFARDSTALLPSDGFPQVSDQEARAVFQRSLDANDREQGTNIADALALAARRVAEDDGPRRPMLVVVTDGMLPTGITIDRVRSSFVDAVKGGRLPEVLFIVDEPMLLESGLTPDHGIARLAAALGARISQRVLSQIRVGDRDVLASPSVLGELAIDLPESMNLRSTVPPGLVAGTTVVLEGSYQGAVGTVKVRGRLGARTVTRRVRPVRRTHPGDAFVAVVDQGDQGRAAAEGFALPSWYGSREQRLADLGVAQASRGYGVQRGRIDSHIVHHYLRTRVLPRARVCYNHALSRNQVQKGRVTLEIEVGKGEVMLARTAEAKLDFADESLVDCLTEAAWALEIPAAKLDDRVYTVRYPLNLVPPDGGRVRPMEDPLGKGTLELLLQAAPAPRP